MAEVVAPYAQLAVTDRQKRTAVFEMRVSTLDAQAWVAAANQAGRDATDVGLLLDAVFDVQMPSQYLYKGIHYKALNDAHVHPSGEAEAYNSNKIEVSYTTTNGGVPTTRGVTIAQREPSSYELESNGLNIVLADSDEIANLVTQLNATGLSLYGTAIVVQEMTVNDQ